MAARPDLVCVGAFAGAHGVRGGVKLRSFTEDPEAIAAYGPLFDESGARRFEIRLEGRSGGLLLARLNGVEDRNAAEALKGLRLYVPREALPPPEGDEFYIVDLIGLAVEGKDGEVFGKVLAIHDFGAGELLEIGTAEGRSEMIPFTAEAVPEVDQAGRRIVIDPPAGLFDEAERAGAEDGTEDGAEAEREEGEKG
ncbi:MAG: ribosome maturation factor RimM [Proteobacteria bacterium]|nr:ribosome maturation factor RimM [Pseudomonadota bacterium]